MSRRFGLAALVLTAGTGLSACSEPSEPVVEPVEAPPAAVGEIPITTRSDEAYDLFLEGRHLADRIRPIEARDLYLRALEADRHFALAHLALANSSVSAREFFESMERAVALSEVVSEGERLMIFAQDAAVRGDQVKQLELLERLVERYPTDPRSHLLLGGYHNGRQEYAEAIERYETAVELDPDFSPPYNNLGYLYRAQGRYDDAEQAFLRYIELIPDEPNPYDSHAELLMKVGRFEESIEAYEKALGIKPDFFFSFRGIAYNLIFLGRFDEAREVLTRQFEIAPDIGRQRGAMLTRSLSWLHQGDPERAIEVLEEMSRMAAANEDPVSMAGDLMAISAIRLTHGEADDAEETLLEAVQLIEEANVPDDVKENVERNSHYWLSRIELVRGRNEEAWRHLEMYRDRVAVQQLPGEQRSLHELTAILALAEGDADRALTELGSASQQNPRVLLMTAQAHQALGNLAEARNWARRAAEFNGFGLDYALARRDAQALVDSLG